jgi:hypothetical protein
MAKGCCSSQQSPFTVHHRSSFDGFSAFFAPSHLVPWLTAGLNRTWDQLWQKMRPPSFFSLQSYEIKENNGEIAGKLR